MAKGEVIENGNDTKIEILKKRCIVFDEFTDTAPNEKKAKMIQVGFKYVYYYTLESVIINQRNHEQTKFKFLSVCLNFYIF
jgi:hypothetical protein